MRKIILIIICGLFLSFRAEAAASFTTGSFLLNTSTGNQAVTGAGFQPKLVIFFAGQKADAQGESNDVRFMYGAAVSSTKRWALAGSGGWGSGNSDARNGWQADRCIIGVNTFAATVDFEADMVTLDADGFTINVTTASATSYRIFYMAFGGSDISADVGTFTISATGSKAITGVGFQPTLIGLGVASASADGYGNFTEGSIGWATASSNRYALSWAAQNNVADTNSVKSQISTGVLQEIWITPVVEDLADFTSMDADGFTINVSSNVNSPVVGYIAMRGASFKLGAFNEPTSTGNASVTGVGFQPSMVAVFSFSAASTASIIDGENLMIGAATSSSNRRSFDIDCPDAATTSTDQRKTSEALWLTHITGSTNSGNPTNTAEADFVSMDADGFTYNMTTADATSRQVIYVAFAQTPVSSTNTTIYNATLYGATVY